MAETKPVGASVQLWGQLLPPANDGYQDGCAPLNVLP